MSKEKLSKLAKGGTVKKRRDKDTFTEYAEGGAVRKFVGTGEKSAREAKDIGEMTEAFRKGTPNGFRTLKERESYGLPNDDPMVRNSDEAYRRATPPKKRRK